jgi:hypothetical protein
MQVPGMPFCDCGAYGREGNSSLRAGRGNMTEKVPRVESSRNLYILAENFEPERFKGSIKKPRLCRHTF